MSKERRRGSRRFGPFREPQTSTSQSVPLVTVSCNLCGGTATKLVCIDQSFRICKCTNCSLIFVNPQPQFISGEDVHFHASSEIASDRNFRTDKRTVYQDALIQLDRLQANKGRLLDVGCGFGLFLDQAQALGWQPFGVDVSSISVQYASRDLGLANVVRGELLSVGFPTGYFQVATLWNLLEHVRDPLATMREVHRILTSDGIALVRVPNMLVHNLLRHNRSLIHPALRLMGHRPPPYLGGISPPHHLYGFTPATMKALLHLAGFKRVDTLPAVPHNASSSIGRIARGIGSVASTVSARRLVLTPAFVAYAYVSPKTVTTAGEG